MCFQFNPGRMLRPTEDDELEFDPPGDNENEEMALLPRIMNRLGTEKCPVSTVVRRGIVHTTDFVAAERERRCDRQ